MLKKPCVSRVSPHLFDLVKWVMHTAATDRLDSKNSTPATPALTRAVGSIKEKEPNRALFSKLQKKRNVQK